MTTMRKTLDGLAPAAALALLLLLGACDTSDGFAVRNSTGATLDLALELGDRFSIYACAGSDDDEGRVRVDGRAELTLDPGAARCFEGPVAGSEYDALDLLLHVVVRRGDATCVDADGAALRDRFVPQDGSAFDLLVIDDALCAP